MILLGVDLETTGVEKDSEITEVGLIRIEDGQPINCYSTLTRIDGDISEGASSVTGLTTELCNNRGKSLSNALAVLADLSWRADYYVVHNGINFDIPLLKKHTADTDFDLNDLPVIDTAIDVPYPSRIRTRALTCLAAEHGLLNPFPHKAQFDVAVMLKILRQYDLDAIAETARSPLIVVNAGVNYHSRQMAKDAGYHWNGEVKLWLKQMRECTFDAEQDEVEFKMIKAPQHAKLFETF